MNDKLTQTYKLVYARDGYSCKKCGKPAMQIAHKIRQGSKTIKNPVIKHIKTDLLQIYNSDKSVNWIFENIVYHKFNLIASCQNCNDSFNIWNKPVKAQKLLMEIYTDVEKSLD